jgi:hypothetical protein
MTINKTMPVSAICDHLISNAADKTLAIGPLTWQPSDGTSAKRWYFIVGFGDTARQFHCEAICLDADQRDADYNRIHLELMSRVAGRAFIIHTFDDEITFARWCERLWPCEKITSIRKATEADYASRKPADA